MYSHLAVLDALEQEPLIYKHVPLLMNPNGTKLSKRIGGIGIEGVREKGMNAEDLIGLLASSLDFVPEGSVLTVKELLSELNKNKARIESL